MNYARSLSVLAMTLCLAAMTSTSWAEAKPRLTPEQLAAAASTVTGKLVFTTTITLSSTFPAADVIACSAQALVLDTGSGNDIIESTEVAATKSGSTATCTVTIPYSWNLLTPTADFVNLTFSVRVPATPATAAATLPNRTNTQTLGRIPIPASGTTTTETVKVTI